MQEAHDSVYRILEANIKRSNRLGKWTAPDIIEWEYWDVRYILAKKMQDGINAFIDYVIEKYHVREHITTAQKVSFFFHIKDELEKVSEMERTGNARLIPHIAGKKNDKLKPSPRRQMFPEAMELALLANYCPIKSKEIKKMKYSDVWQMLLAISIKREDRYE